MELSIPATIKKIYPFIFALSFWSISIAPIFKTDVSIATFEDNFLGYETLIEDFNTLRYLFGDHVFPNVVVGKDGWLFYTGERAVDDFQLTNPFSDSELSDYQKGLDTLYFQLQQKGVMLVVFIAPDKNTIYPEYMPDQIIKIGTQSRLDQIADYMHKYGKAPIIDCRLDLLSKSKTEQVFYKTNSHWNPLGEYLAYKKIISELSQRYPALVSHPFSDYQVVNAGLITHDIPRIMGIPKIMEEYWTLHPTFEIGTKINRIPLSDGTNVRFSRNQDQNLPSVLIYHDSFLNGVIPFLEPHFRQIISIPRTSVPGIWDISWIDLAHPDIVIIESAERFLNYDIFFGIQQ